MGSAGALIGKTQNFIGTCAMGLQQTERSRKSKSSAIMCLDLIRHGKIWMVDKHDFQCLTRRNAYNHACSMTLAAFCNWPHCLFESGSHAWGAGGRGAQQFSKQPQIILGSSRLERAQAKRYKNRPSPEPSAGAWAPQRRRRAQRRGGFNSQRAHRLGSSKKIRAGLAMGFLIEQPT